jgi:H+/Cl- antiporter ClcA
MYAQIITSSLTVGLGGSAGLESPIVVAGAALDQIMRSWLSPIVGLWIAAFNNCEVF